MKILSELEIEQKLKQFFKGAIKIDEPLAKYTALKIGGLAKLFLVPLDDEDLSSLCRFLKNKNMPLQVIGLGSNLLVSDGALSAAILKLDSAAFKAISRQDNTIYTGAAVTLAQLMEYAKKHGFSGCEFLAGIPGTVGGALVMNAGVRDVRKISNNNFRSISDILTKVKLMDNEGNILILAKENINFGYRFSNLNGYIVLGAWFELFKEEISLIEQNIKKFLAHKQMTQVLAEFNAGCIFKNPQDKNLSAGYLIEQCQLKGKAIGNAQVSDIHANFIVNKGKASFREFRELMNFVQQEVYRKFEIWLEPEIKIWDET